MLERLNLESLKGINLSQVKGMGDTALKELRGIDMSKVKTLGDTALKGISKLSKKRMKVGSYSVNPFLVAGAAALVVGGYLIYRSMSNRSSLDSSLEGQAYPIK